MSSNDMSPQAAYGKRRHQEIHQRIIEALRELLEHYRPEQITVSLAISKAAVNRITFFKHFATLEEAIKAATQPE